MKYLSVSSAMGTFFRTAAIYSIQLIIHFFSVVYKYRCLPMLNIMPKHQKMISFASIIHKAMIILHKTPYGEPPTSIDVSVRSRNPQIYEHSIIASITSIFRWEWELCVITILAHGPSSSISYISGVHSGSILWPSYMNLSGHGC